MRWIILTFMLCAGCTDLSAINEVNVHTGTGVKTSKARLRVINATTTLEARVIRVRASGQDRYAIKTFVLRSDLNFPKVVSAYSFGIAQPYRRDDRLRVGRLRAEAGHIPLSLQDVHRHAQNGFSFQLSGPRGTYEFVLPASMFAAVLEPG